MQDTINMFNEGIHVDDVDATAAKEWFEEILPTISLSDNESNSYSFGM